MQLSSLPPNGLRYLRVGGRGQNSKSRILFRRGKCPKMPQNPTRQVHALLGMVELEDSLIETRDHSPFFFVFTNFDES